MKEDINIVLCGFMGSGKTSVGKRLAKETGRLFCDTDQYIEEKYGMNIAEIFSEFGEERFRQMETEVVSEVSAKKNMVIACGGGTVLRQQNVAIFHQYGCEIFLLEVPVDVLQERLKNDCKRPLLQKSNRNEIIAELYNQRVGCYREVADVAVNGAVSPLKVIEQIIAKLEN